MRKKIHPKTNMKREAALRRTFCEVVRSFCRCCFHALEFGGNERFLRLYIIARKDEKYRERRDCVTFILISDGHLRRYIASNILDVSRLD